MVDIFKLQTIRLREEALHHWHSRCAENGKYDDSLPTYVCDRNASDLPGHEDTLIGEGRDSLTFETDALWS